jgi:hypothetical protein
MRRLLTKVADRTTGCGWTTLASVRAERVKEWLQDIKRHGVPYVDKEGTLRRKETLPSDRTVDQYLEVAKRFLA